MKNNSSVFNIIVLVLGVALTVVLTQSGCQQATNNVESSHDESHHEKPDGPQRPPMQVNDASLAEDADLDEVVRMAVESISKGRETGDMMMVMNDGIMMLRAVTERDPDNEQAIYQLGMLSVESGQLQKAKKRFEKLILLHPENQEYQKTLSEIQSNLEK